MRRRGSRSERRCRARQAEAEEDAAGKGASLLSAIRTSAQAVPSGTQGTVLLHDKRPPQRHHEEHAEKAADEGQHEDARVLQVEAEEDERGQGEDDARGDGLAGVAGGLDE